MHMGKTGSFNPSIVIYFNWFPLKILLLPLWEDILRLFFSCFSLFDKSCLISDRGGRGRGGTVKWQCCKTTGNIRQLHPDWKRCAVPLSVFLTSHFSFRQMILRNCNFVNTISCLQSRGLQYGCQSVLLPLPKPFLFVFFKCWKLCTEICTLGGEK